MYDVNHLNVLMQRRKKELGEGKKPMIVVVVVYWSLEFGVELVIGRAQVLPVLCKDLGLRSASASIGSFGEDDGKTGFKMPVNVTVQEPGSWIIRNCQSSHYVNIWEQ